MSISSAIYDYLVNNAGVAALVGTRIYPSVSPTSAMMPRITYQLISANHSECVGGSAGLCEYKIQLSAWGYSDLSTDATAEAIRQALQGYSGTTGGVLIYSALMDSEITNIEDPQDGSEKFIYVRHCSYSIQAQESIPTN